MIYPGNYEQKIGFDKIRQLLHSFCLSTLGKERVDNMCFTIDYDNILEQLIQIDEFKSINISANPLPLEYIMDCRPILHRLQTVGTFPEVDELFNIKRSLETIKKIYYYLKKDQEKYPALWKITENIKIYPYIEERTESILTSQGKIKDNASAELSKIRQKIVSLNQEISKRILRLLNQAKQEGIVEPDATLAVRDGRLVIPINTAYKRYIKGFIYDESSTGKTTYIEPAEIVELNNDLKELEIAERREIVRILTQWANDIRPYIRELIEYYFFLGTIDFIRAKTLFANEINAVRPSLSPQPIIEWYHAIHPLLYLHLKNESKEVVPLNIRLTSKQHILIISGPNAGGKSVCLKTVGLLQYMLQCGMQVPVKVTSEMGIFENIFIDMGDEQSIENDLSTYSSHLLNMKFFIKNSNTRTLFLIDEFGSGTEPTIGGAIAESILNELNKSQAFGIVTTHYTNLKHFASNTEGVINGAMLFDVATLSPTFQLMIGEPGSSFAIEIARKIGLPEQIIQQASEKVGNSYIEYDSNLRQIIREKHYWQKKREQVKETSKRLEALIEKYKTELEEINKIRKETIQKAKQDALALINDANKKIENTIREIKEAQAEKERTKLLRSEITELKNQLNNLDHFSDDKIERKIQKLKEREEKKAKSAVCADKNFQESKIKTSSITALQKGDKVKLYGQEVVGEVLEVNGKNILVAFGNMITTLPEIRLQKISNQEYKNFIKQYDSNQLSPLTHLTEKRKNFQLQLDVRGLRANEAIEKVEDYIDDAIMLGIHEVKILHGKGNGILRQMIRELLKSIEWIETYGDEHVDFGGAGITVIKFKT